MGFAGMSRVRSPVQWLPFRDVLRPSAPIFLGFRQEWAASVALEAWDEASSLLARLSRSAPLSSSSESPSLLWLEAATPLDAISRRCRQVERILEASIVSKTRRLVIYFERIAEVVTSHTSVSFRFCIAVDC